jgi:hypothetical protein
MLVPDYDSSDTAPLSKVQALAYEDCARGQAWTEFCFEAHPENLRALPQYYVTGSAPPAGTDVKTYQVGNMFLCVAGFTATPTVGELWVEYDITLITPDLSLASYDSEELVSTTMTNVAPLVGMIPNQPAIAIPIANSLDYTINGVGTTLTVNQAFKGLILWQLTGTVVSTMSITTAGVIGAATALLINAAGTIGNISYLVNLVPGDVLTFASTGAVPTAAVIYFAAL